MTKPAEAYPSTHKRWMATKRELCGADYAQASLLPLNSLRGETVATERVVGRDPAPRTRAVSSSHDQLADGKIEASRPSMLFEEVHGRLPAR